jgi:hypothetical protein
LTAVAIPLVTIVVPTEGLAAARRARTEHGEESSAVDAGGIGEHRGRRQATVRSRRTGPRSREEPLIPCGIVRTRDRLAAWLVTGPLGHLWSALADIVLLWTRYVARRALRAARR